MDELQNGLDISLSGPERDRALERFTEQITAWQTVMPDVEPLVLDFGLGDFARVGLIEYWIANEVAAGYCGKYLFVFDEQTCPTHHHHEKMETFFVVRGRVRMTLDDRALELAAGDTLTVRPGERHSFTGIGPALLLELSKPCIVADNEFADPAIAIGRSGSRAS